ncbi:MAG TPA: ABC transporter permease [Thermoanaerobaculia bacterium]|nr:ABC transporter permease [Thermoanaerobaculia bacterium]HQR66333.1 ABC transporter permease [Thermoanaerobaculia bacterium]
MTLATVARRHLTARPLRTLLTMGAIALSAGLMGFLLLFADALKQDWSPLQAQRAIVMAKTSFFEKLPMAYLPKLSEVPGVREIAPFDFMIGFYRDTRPENQIPVNGTDADPFVAVYVEAGIPKEQVAAWKDDPTGCVIGWMLADRFGWKPGTRLVLKAPVRGGVVETTVRAVMSYHLDNGVYLHRRYYEQLTGEEGRVAMFWILARSRDDVAPMTAEIDRRFENAPAPIRAMTEKQWQLMFMQMLGNVKLLLGSIGLATAFALVLITSNTLAMSARERRNETAVLRILGFGRRAVFGILLAESAFYGLLGALLGMGLVRAFSTVIGVLLDKTQMQGFGQLLRPDLQSDLTVLGLALGLAVVAGSVPALNLSRRPIVQLLREPG